MTEAELQDAVVECAHLFGWRVAHFRPAMTTHGWRTPVSADGRGFPDLLMLRGTKMIVAELKSDSGRLSEDQQAWLAAFDWLTKASTFVWKPKDWTDGTIERALRP